ncbi:hypothetical protein Peur_020967 [Populus x canadensis]
MMNRIRLLISLNYPTYDKELYALVRTLETWQHYLWPKEFVIHSDHESLKHLKGQGFEHIKELYKDDSDFANVYNACETSAFGKFYRLDGYLFKESRLCVPLSSMRELLGLLDHMIKRFVLFAIFLSLGFYPTRVGLYTFPEYL